MAVKQKQITKDEYVKSLGIELTEEQLAGMDDTFTIEVEVEDKKELSWEEVQAKFKTQINEGKEKAVKDRFGNKGQSKEIDVESIKKEAIEQAKLATLLGGAVSANDLDETQTAKFETLVNSDIKGGKTIEEAISSNIGLFAKQEIKRVRTDFGHYVEEKPGKIKDPIQAEMEQYIQSRE